MEGKENIVLYDWLSFTSKNHTPEQLIEALGLTHCPWQETKGAHGYRDRKYFSCISVHYNGREDMGILDIDEVVEDTRRKHYVSRSDYWETVLSSKGSTVQIGSPQSKVLVRIYDKAAERHCEPGTHWVRVEMQLRDDRALQFTKIPMTVGEAFSGVLLNYLRYVIPDDTDTNKWRWQMTDYWLDMLEVLTPIKIYTAPGMDYNIDRCREYVVNQAGNAIDALLQIYGIHEFQRLIRERPTVENPKYIRLVQQYKADRLSAMAGRYMT